MNAPLPFYATYGSLPHNIRDFSQHEIRVITYEWGGLAHLSYSKQDYTFDMGKDELIRREQCTHFIQ